MNVLTIEFPPFCGGAGFYLYELVDALGKDIHTDIYMRDVPVYTTPQNAVMNTVPTVSPHIITYNLGLRRREHTLKKSIGIHNECAGLFFSNTFYRETVPMMIVHHLSMNEPYSTVQRRIKLVLWQKLQDVMASKADYFIFPNEQIAQDIITRYKDKEYFIVPNGIVIDAFKNVLHESVESIKKDYNRIMLFFPGGASNERKGLVNFFSVLKKINQISEVVLVVSGYNPGVVKSVKEIISKNRVQNVVLTGDLDYTDVVAYYKACDIVVFPSLYEGFGRPLLEAMAAGKPIITFPVGVANEVITHNVTGFIAHDNNEFVDILADLTKDKKKREIIGKNAEKSPVLNQYRWDKIAQDFVKVLDSLR